MPRFLAVILFVCSLSLAGLLAACEAPADEASLGPAAETSVRPPWVDDAVIYELFVRDFTPEGTFRAVIPRLPELRDLGVTTIWLMPIHPVGEVNRKGPLGSPYSIKDFKDVNPLFGTKEDFRALVDAVHAEGMHLIIDLVANHTAFDNAWTEDHPEWYTRNDAGEIIHPEGTDWTDVADLNYDEPGVRAAMQDAMTYWVREFDIDGYRCDVAGMVPLDFWEEAIAAVRAIKPVLMLAEGEEPELHDVGFDLTYSWRLYGQLKEVWNEGAPASTFVEVVQEQQEAFADDALRLRFITNHDETAWDAPPVELFGGQQGSQAAAVATLLLPGVPLVYNGQEVGSAQELPLFEKEAIIWEQNPDMRAFYQNLLTLHQTSEAARAGTVTFLAPEHDDVIVYELTAVEDRVVVAANTRDRAVTMELPEALVGSSFTDAFTDAPIMLEELAFEPYGYYVLRVDR